MDPKVWGKLLTLHRRGYDDVEALRDDGPLPAELWNRPQDGISWIQKVAAVELGFWLMFWSFRDTWIYMGGRSTSVELRGAHEAGGCALHPLDRLVAFLTEGPSLLDLIWWENHVSEGFIPFGLRLIFLFFKTLKQAKNNNSGLGLRLIG